MSGTTVPSAAPVPVPAPVAVVPPPAPAPPPVLAPLPPLAPGDSIKSPQFILAMYSLTLGFALLFYALSKSELTAIQASLVTIAEAACIVGVLQFFFSSSVGSQRKDRPAPPVAAGTVTTTPATQTTTEVSTP